MTNEYYIQKMAKAICQFGKCETCDKDCIDYKAAERAFYAYAKQHNDVVDEFANKLVAAYSAPMYQEPGAHTMIIKLFGNIRDIQKEMTIYDNRY